MQLEMHVDAERVERLLHGELSPDEARAAHAHLESCASCRATVDAARSQEAEVLALLGTLDHTPPAFDLAAVRVRRHQRWPLRWAAGFAFALVAAGTAYALPGSPLRAWIRSLVSRVSAVEASGGASPAAPTVSEPERQVAGVIVAPGERFRIDLLVGNAGAPPAERTTTAAGEVVVNP